jgi:hypothetical protein
MITPPNTTSGFSRQVPAWFLIVFIGLLVTSCSTASPANTTEIAQTSVLFHHQATINASIYNQQTQTASVPTETQRANTPQPTEARTPTVTPTAGNGPIEGSLERASFDLAADWGPGHTRDDFDDPFSGDFPTYEIGSSKSWYGHDGYYHISDTDSGRYVWFWTFPSLANFYVDVVVINGPNCNARDSAGLVFRGNQLTNEGYLFGVTCSGHFHVGFKGGPNPGNTICSATDYDAWNCSALSTLHASEYTASGPGAMNRVGVYARNKVLDFYINGNWVYRISTDNFANFPVGGFALYLGTFQPDLAEAAYEDFNIWSVP